MVAFWRKQPLDYSEHEILHALFDALQQGTFKQCPSTVGIATSAFGSGDYSQALSSGLLCTGGIHFPFNETYDLLTAESPEKLAKSLLEVKRKVPGWGSSFVTGVPDQDWERVDALLGDMNATLHQKIESVTSAIIGSGKSVYPNSTCYTVATAITVKMPRPLVPYLVLKGKLDAWSAIFLENVKGF